MQGGTTYHRVACKKRKFMQKKWVIKTKDSLEYSRVRTMVHNLCTTSRYWRLFMRAKTLVGIYCLLAILGQFR